jgi:putative nucleotidyltransferase with HDIG domain
MKLQLVLKYERRVIMENAVPNREGAYALLQEFNRNESLIKHALTVEAVMRHFAGLLGEDEEKWGIIGLVHDLDYEMYPEQHCIKVREILKGRNWPEAYIHAVESHGWKLCCNVEPVERMEKVLYTIDELTGLIAANALMRPSKSIMDMEGKSVKKKWKQRSFAAGVNREVIEEGAAMLGMDLDKVIEETINGMRKVAEEIGLKGDI